ncbi:hypothetical protein [Steroidobacter agaridevorans]|uniref:hypothetical protein n=1 Tax=Steroidobacter agaridevorans TaxID=2695856 RepID=UPI00192A4BC8|nr:hypothetical protein [Steroidobacter agaridevorans]
MDWRRRRPAAQYAGGPRQLARTNGTIASFEQVTDLVSDQLLSVGAAAGQVTTPTSMVK